LAEAATEQTARRYRRFADQPTRAVGISFADRACSHGHLLTANDTNPTQLKAGNGALCGSLVIANPTSVTAGDLRFYDTASVTTATGSSVASVVWNVPAPTNSTAANVAGWSIPISDRSGFLQRRRILLHRSGGR
jgi:hypothetical protein